MFSFRGGLEGRELVRAVVHEVSSHADGACVDDILGEDERGFVLDLVGCEVLVERRSASGGAGQVEDYPVLEQAALDKFEALVGGEVSPACPPEAGGSDCEVCLFDERVPVRGVCVFDVGGGGFCCGDVGALVVGQFRVACLAAFAPYRRCGLVCLEAGVVAAEDGGSCPPDALCIFGGQVVRRVRGGFSWLVLLICGEGLEEPPDGEFFDVDLAVIGDRHFGIDEVHSSGHLLDNPAVVFPYFSEKFFMCKGLRLFVEEVLVGVAHRLFSLVGGVGDG